VSRLKLGAASDCFWEALLINFFSEEVRRNPFPAYDQIRAASPVVHDPQSGLWMIFDHQGVKRALTDHQAFSSSMLAAGRRNPQWIIFFDPPRQTRLRALISQAFTPHAIANLEPRIGELSRELLNRQIERGEMDMAADFAIPLPMMVIAEMIGIPSTDWPRFRSWSDSILKLSYTISGGDQAAAASAEFFQVTLEMAEYLPAMIDERRLAPKDDLLTRLVHAELDGERLTRDEIVAFVQLLLVAGNETTTNLLNNAILSLIENPDQLARLRAAPELLPLAIEEVLRYRSPLQWMFRATTRDVELDGITIPSGKLVLPMIGAANRDPKAFPGADRFDIAREPNPHLAFGHGIHFCLGAPLSRLEARIALTHFLERVHKFEMASDQPWEPRKALHVHGPAALPIRFEPGRRAAAAG
jgi:cytochrome P450